MKGIARAAGNAAKDKKRKGNVSDSDSSDSLVEAAQSVRKTGKGTERELMKAKERERALRRELKEIEARNEAATAINLAARNSFPVFLSVL